MEQSFNEYFEQKLKEKNGMTLRYSRDELEKIYREEYEYKKNAPKLEIKLEPQLVTVKLADYYLPEKWELVDGKLLFSEEELQNALKLIIYNLGAEQALRVIPKELIEKYIGEGKKE